MLDFDAFNAMQDQVLHAASAHIDRVVLETFFAEIESCNDPASRKLFDIVCDWYTLSVIEEGKAGILGIDAS
ncbi:acyl-CoA dehydrogenase [Mycobacterium lepromatosis]|uniref:acyl-CoA dehydrogenase n=1 Tax=Mycobacterium lepromatosis TaxID=480418 RepID=UPI000A74BC40|nr:acyl-CoA dehydrogenase [Mycobacterium lepromatosis]